MTDLKCILIEMYISLSEYCLSLANYRKCNNIYILHQNLLLGNYYKLLNKSLRKLISAYINLGGWVG